MSQVTPKKVALVDLPDEAMDVLSDYTRNGEYEVVVVVGPRSDSQAANMAGMLQIPWTGSLSAEELSACHRVIVGPEGRLAEVQALLQGTEVSIASLEPNQLTREKPEEKPATTGELLELLGGDPFQQTPEEENPAGTELEDANQATRPDANRKAPALAKTPARCDSASGLIGISELPNGAKLQLNHDHPDLKTLLDELVQVSGAQTASVMLPDEDGKFLLIAASVGLEPSVVKSVRQKVGEGLAGEAFATGDSRTFEAEVPGIAEAEFGPRMRISASVPILSDGQAIGVLSVNCESDKSMDADALVASLEEAAQRSYATLVKAVSLTGLDPATLQEVLLRQIDRLMSQGQNLAHRLSDVGEALRSACAADDYHVFVADPLGRRLEEVTGSGGLTAGANHPSLDHGFLGWSMRHAHPLVLVATAPGVPERRANAYLPVHTAQPQALIVLENVPVDDILPDELESILFEVSEVLGEVIGVEEGMGHQELLSDLKMRIADASARTVSSSPVERTQSLLELTLDVLAARSAVWVPDEASRPLTTPPRSEEERRILAESWFLLDQLTEQARQRRVVSWGMGEETVTDDTPQTEFPYAAVRARNGDGVLLVFFRGDQSDTRQLPLPAVFEVMFSLSRLMPKRGDGTSNQEEPRGNQDRMLNFEELIGQLSQEWRRSQRLAHSFTLTRFRVADEGAGQDVNANLRDFLRRNKRSIDFLAEGEGEVFVLLSPETGSNADGLRQRYTRMWERIAPDQGLFVDQCVFPRDGQTEEVYHTWIDGLRRSA